MLIQDEKKRVYAEPDLELYKFDINDVITTSDMEEWEDEDEFPIG